MIQHFLIFYYYHNLFYLLSLDPIMGRQPITFQRSNRLANRDSWSKLTVAAKMSPHTEVPDVIEFLESWNGPANFISS